jgi:AraC-like DNA-binding protein
MKIFIKYMVSLRCKMIVKSELNSLGLHNHNVELGVIEILDECSSDQLKQFDVNLRKSGLEIIDDQRAILIEKIKNVVIEMIHYSDDLPLMNYSDFISEKLEYDYTYLSNMFSEITGLTIQHYIILHKIEKVKELILYDELSLTEISFRLHYSSVAHLSNQFKKITGLTPSFFKKIGSKRRKNLHDV